MKPSEIVRTKLEQNGGRATVYSINGKPCKIWLTAGSTAFASDKLPKPAYKLTLFDIIVDYMQKHDGRIDKGHARNNRFGYPGCDANTMVGIIALEMEHPQFGDSILDPVFVFAAIFDWSNIAYNDRGYLELKHKTGGDF